MSALRRRHGVHYNPNTLIFAFPDHLTELLLLLPCQTTQQSEQWQLSANPEDLARIQDEKHADITMYLC